MSLKENSQKIEMKSRIPRRKYRTELEIMSDILGIITETGLIGMSITTLARNANLSYNVAYDKIGKLIKSDLVKIHVEKNNMFVITEKGIKFFHELRKFEDFIQEIRNLNSI
jgi:predicted transcriptional regulator